MGDGRRERWRAHREARRAELIQAVVAAVNERGAGIGMDDVAAASGIAKPVFYRYFADKADLFQAVGRTVAEELVIRITSAIDEGTSARGMLAQGIAAYLANVEENPELYRFVVHQRFLDKPVGDDPVADYATTIATHVARVIGSSMRRAGLDSGAAEPWGFGVVGMVRAAADRWLDNKSMSREELASYLTDLAWPGLAQYGRVAPARRPHAV